MTKEAQREVIEKFYATHGQMTLKQMSTMTGIQLTRVFRILNGYEMKLGEYLTFQKLVEDPSGERQKSKLEELTTLALKKLSLGALKELEWDINSRLRASQLAQTI